VTHPSPIRDLRPDIQALRAVAVSIVVAFHLRPDLLPGGFVGVDVFFVISGFLITRHLVEHPPTNASGLLAFWGRRIRRLLPASLLVLATSVVAAWAFLPETQWQATAEQARSAALYYVNWTLLGNAVDYLSADRVPTIVQHYWSLAVEEQFYLLWPILLLLLTLLARKRYAIGLGVVVAASFAYSIYLTDLHPAAAYFSTWTRIWELGAGGLLAVLSPRIAAGLKRAPGAISLLLVGAGWVGIALSCFVINSNTLFPGSAAALPIVGALLVIAGKVQFRPYSWLPVHWLGDVSYSVYLWHWPLLLVLPVIIARGAGAPGRGTLDNIAIVLTTLVLAGLTKYFVEDRFRTLAWTKRLRATYVMGAAGMAIVVALATTLHFIEARGMDTAQAELESALATKDKCLGAGSLDLDLGCPEPTGTPIPSPPLAENDRGPAYEDQPSTGNDCSSKDKEGFPLVTCTFGDPKGKFDVALFGNSHAAQWLPAIVDVAKARHWKITTYIVSSCVPVELRADWDRGSKAATECLRWTNHAIAKIKAERPDLIVFTNRTSNPAKGENSLRDSFNEWEAAYHKTLTRLATIKRPIAVIQDTPASIWSDIKSPPDCVASRKNVDDCSGPRSTWVPDDPAVAAAETMKRSKVNVVDLNDYLCTLNTCYAVVGGVIAYADGSHMTATFNRTLAPYLDEELQEALGK
jgi:peptidoglycan/LPS O-acetylase OafA/YrhL